MSAGETDVGIGPVIKDVSSPDDRRKESGGRRGCVRGSSSSYGSRYVRCKLTEDGESEMDGFESILRQHWQRSVPLSRGNIVASSFQVVIVVLWENWMVCIDRYTKANGRKSERGK